MCVHKKMSGHRYYGEIGTPYKSQHEFFNLNPESFPTTVQYDGLAEQLIEEIMEE